MHSAACYVAKLEGWWLLGAVSIYLSTSATVVAAAFNYLLKEACKVENAESAIVRSWTVLAIQEVQCNYSLHSSHTYYGYVTGTLYWLLL